MLIAFDDNLGLPSDFGMQLDCETVSFHEIGDMLSAFATGQVGAMFAPAGTLVYLTADHDIVAQATIGPDRKRTLESELVVRADASTADVAHLARQPIGCINRYCTTSYWAPMIALLGTTSTDTPLHFSDATGFRDLLDGVVEGRTATAMVWDAVLDRDPASRKKTRTVLRRTGLPCPIIVTGKLSTDDRRRLTDSIVGFDTSDTSGFFGGFDPPDHGELARFEREMADARRHYHV